MKSAGYAADDETMFSYVGPWIPRADGKFLLFANQFCGGINADPARYMMTPAQANSLMQEFQVFEQALAIARSDKTRNKGTIVDKDNARHALQDLIEAYGSFIRVNRGIQDSDKIDIGVRPRNIAHQKRTGKNLTAPLLNFLGSTPGIDYLTYLSALDMKAKPYGAERLELWVAYTHPEAGQPQPLIADARLIGSFKKSKMIVPQDPMRDVRLAATGPGTGMPVYWARWVGYDGTAGPWSLACYTTIKAKAATQIAEVKTEFAVDQPLKVAA